MVLGKLLPLNKFVVFSVLIIALLAATITVYATHQSPVNDISLYSWKIDTSQLADGDLIFRKGHDLVSRLILSQGDSTQFSHVGIIIKQDNAFSVVHALPEDVGVVSGVQIESLNDFSSAENASDIAIYRFNEIDSAAQQNLKQFIMQQIGKPFDSGFLLSSDDKLYCTELAIKAYAHAGVDLFNLNPVEVVLVDEPVVPPDHLRKSGQFEHLKISERLKDGSQLNL